MGKRYREEQLQRTHGQKQGGWKWWEVGMAGVVGRSGGERQKMYLNNNKIQKYLIKKGTGNKKHNW